MLLLWTVATMFLIGTSYCCPYDPKDQKLISVLPPEGTFEAFYPP